MDEVVEMPYWPSALAPREKLLSLGKESLSDQELLAIFLRTGIKGTNVMALSSQLIREFGSIYALMQADYDIFLYKTRLGNIEICPASGRDGVVETLFTSTAN